MLITGKKLLIVVNDPNFFLSHRLPIAIKAKSEGFTVHIATMPGKSVEKIIAMGFHHSPIFMTRSGKNVFHEVKTFFSILFLLFKIKPDIAHFVTIKPVIYGGIAARLSSVHGVVAAISGLGFIFNPKTINEKITLKITKFFYRIALGKKNIQLIFQNTNDRDSLLSLCKIPDSKVNLIKGSGVDLNIFTYTPATQETPIICMASRLLLDKGVAEFVTAAQILKGKGVNARFQLIGDIDVGNPRTVTKTQIEQWKKENVVEVVGHRNDIAKLFSSANIIVFPSYYGEGLPKVLIEAAACGRPIITTDHPGCRDAIENGTTGILVPIKDITALSNAMEQLINSSELRDRMGRAAREFAEKNFSIESVTRQHVDIYKELLNA